MFAAVRDSQLSAEAVCHEAIPYSSHGTYLPSLKGLVTEGRKLHSLLRLLQAHTNKYEEAMPASQSNGMLLDWPECATIPVPFTIPLKELGLSRKVRGLLAMPPCLCYHNLWQ